MLNVLMICKYINVATSDAGKIIQSNQISIHGSFFGEGLEVRVRVDNHRKHHKIDDSYF